jgi:hypothetical protein
MIRDTGLGIEDMNAEELEMMLEGDGEEVVFDTGSVAEDAGDNMEFEATQSSDEHSTVCGVHLFFLTHKYSQDLQGFHPLFED